MRSHTIAAMAGLTGWLALCLLCPGIASAELVRELPLNSTVRGSVEVDGGADTYEFVAVAGLELSATLKGGSKSVMPFLVIADPNGNLLDVPGPSSSGKTKAKHLRLTVGGTYRLRIIVARAGSYKLKFKAKSAKQKMEMTVPENGQGTATFETFADARLKIDARRSEKDGPRPVFESMTAPGGGDVAPGKTLNAGSKGFKIKKLDLTETGVYTMEVSHEDGLAGTCEVEIELSDPPKAGNLDEDDLSAGRIDKIRLDGPDDDDEAWFFRVEVLDTPSVLGVTLEIPGKDDVEMERDITSGLYSLLESYADQAALDAEYPDGDYTIRIDRGEEEEDLTIAISVSGDFPDLAMPGTPSSPQNGDWGVSLTPTIWWDAVTGAASYEAEIRREGVGTVLHRFETDDPAERQFDVPGGALVEGPVYRLAILTRTVGNKASATEIRFTTAAAASFEDAWIDKVEIKRVVTSNSAGIEDHHFEIQAGFTGQGVVLAQLEYLTSAGFNPAPIPPDGNGNDYELGWRFEAVELAPGTWLIDVVVPDGEYQIRVTYLDGTEEVSDPLEVALDPSGIFYRVPKFKEGPANEAANVLTPTWRFICAIRGSGAPVTKEFKAIIEDNVTGEVVADETFEGTWGNGVYDVSFRAPIGALQKKREYSLTLIAPNLTGRSSQIWLSFNTGEFGNVLQYATVTKEYVKDSEGEEKFRLVAGTAGPTLDKAHIRGPLGNLLAMKKSSSTGVFELRISFDTEEALDQAFPDGRYGFEMEYDDGTTDTQRYFQILGDWPTFPEITTPTSDQKKVSKNPGIAWIFPLSETSLGFNVFIYEKGKSSPAWGGYIQSGLFDTRVNPPVKLDSRQKHVLEVSALGTLGKNAISKLSFTTR